ncbi:MAG: 50S ribosomal protein L6 [Alphaproteobacteria bacterium]
MSRIGKHPVKVPSGVVIELSDRLLKVRGKLGQLEMKLPEMIDLTVTPEDVTVRPRDESQAARMQWGTARNIVQNLVKGVSEGFTVDLEINGVGYKAAVQGADLVLNLGFSHEIRYKVPKGITVKCDKPTSVSVSGFDRQLVGQTAAEIRQFRRPEPYKGKGIKYANEHIVRKEGKKK